MLGSDAELHRHTLEPAVRRMPSGAGPCLPLHAGVQAQPRGAAARAHGEPRDTATPQTQ